MDTTKIETFIREHPGVSNRGVAEACGCSHPTVAKVRMLVQGRTKPVPWPSIAFLTSASREELKERMIDLMSVGESEGARVIGHWASGPPIALRSHDRLMRVSRAGGAVREAVNDGRIRAGTAEWLLQFPEQVRAAVLAVTKTRGKHIQRADLEGQMAMTLQKCGEGATWGDVHRDLVRVGELRGVVVAPWTE